MKVIYGIGNLARGPRVPKVVTVGVFDGVHRGHQVILKKCVKDAQDSGASSAVVTFALHPSCLINPLLKVPQLMSLEHKLLYFEKAGIDICYVIDFNKAFAGIAAQKFIKETLIKKLRMVSLYVGEDFVFGKHAEGNKNLLKVMSKELNFRLHIVRHLKIKNRIVSSTLIREMVRRCDLAGAETFLGRPVCLLGKVIKGEGRGKSLGFPTANIHPPCEVLLPDGIYATEVLYAGRSHKGATYIGSKPTFRNNKRRRSIEVFLLELRKNIYGHKLEIFFIRKLRDDRKFPSKEALVLQIKKDIEAARKILS